MTAKPATGHNTKRSLDVIGADLRKLRNIFDSGALLVEGKNACEHGEWLPWIESYFDASVDTAERHMAAYHLSLKFRTVRNLEVPPTIIYRLADEFIDDPDLPVVIKALVKESGTAERPLSVAAANEVVDLTKLRIKFGDYPPATLFALNERIPDDAEWAAGASEELKKARPTTEEEADKIVLAYRRKHLDGLFGGALPDWLDERMLNWLGDVEEQHRKGVMRKLQAASQPLDWRQVVEITNDARFLSDDQDDDAEIAPTPEQTDEQDDADSEVPSPPDLDAELLAALHVILHHARRPMPTSVGGIEGAELVEAARFLDKLHELATGGSTVKRVADRAEARSRSGRRAA
jgi:hypothetical protein